MYRRQKRASFYQLVGVEFFKKYMADWFKLHENWFTEPRLQWAIKEQASVVQVWLWALTECCRTKSDTIGLHCEDYEMLGIQQLLNLSPGLFNNGINLLEKIRYIEINKDSKRLKVLKWNDFQSDYLKKKDHRESDKVGLSPTKSDSVVLEERRGDKKRLENPYMDVLVNRLCLLYKRRESTTWDKREVLKAADIIKRTEWESELAEIEEFYKTYEYPRKNIITLMNNWSGELDKARGVSVKPSRKDPCI